jgi:Ni/Fe-hydrogenase subunit HybB-like protein
MIDIGRPYYIWHPLFMWNGNSALFEVGICVVVYVTVLYIEFLPVVTERFIGHVKLPGVLSRLNRPVDHFLRALDRNLSKSMFVFIIAGIVLSTLHQSSLGTLMIIAGPKMHPLWQTPVLPLMFLLSAISVGLPMVIVESILASRAFGLKPEMDVLSRLGWMTTPLLGIYLAFKIGDMFVRKTFVHLASLDTPAVLFIVEVLIGVVLPLRMLLMRRVLRSPPLLFTAALLIVAGVALNRFNNFVVAYTPPYSFGRYVPSFGEVSVTVGFVCLLVLLYRAAVMIFPVISRHDRSLVPKHKFTVRG